MRKKSLLTMLLASSLMLASCGGTQSGDSNKTQKIPEGYTEIVVESQKSGENTFGVGVELDPHFFSHNVKKNVVKEQDWDIVKQRVEKMEIDRFRVMLLPSWIEPFNDDESVDTVNWDKLTLESVEMKSLYKVLDLAESNGIDVNLTLWGVEKNIALYDNQTESEIKSQGGHFLSKNNESNNWVYGTKYPEEFAENFSIYVQHLINTKGYTCIKEVTPVNEPDWSYLINDEVKFENYKNLCLALDDRFKKDGIRDKVLFNLSDNTDNRRHWLEDTKNNLEDIADVYNSHTYIFGYKTKNSDIESWEKANVGIIKYTGKSHVIGEFGSNQNIGSSRQTDIDLYERGVLMLRQLLNFYNAGATGASYWVLFDQYYSYTDPYESMLQLGLWKSSKESYFSDTAYYEKIKEDYEVRPQYYAYSLASKYIAKGAEVYPIYLNNDFAVGTAFKGKDGKWTYFFANGNDSGDSMKLALKVSGEFEKYEYNKESLPKGDNLISASGIANDLISFELAPQTVVVWKQK